MTATRRPEFFGWKLLAAYWLILFAVLGWPPYGIGIVNTYMAEQLGFDRTMLGVPYSVLMLIERAARPLVAMLVMRKGVRFTIITGCLTLVAASSFMALFAQNFWAAVFGGGVLAGAGVVTGERYRCRVPPCVLVRAPARARVRDHSVSGWYRGVFAPPVLNFVMSEAGDWRAGWWVFAAFAALATIVAFLFARAQPSDLGQHPDGIAPTDAAATTVAASTSSASPARGGRAGVHQTTEAWTVKEAVRSPTLWLLLFCACGMSMGYTWFLSHGIAHIQDLGHSKSVAALTASSMAGTTLLGKFAVGVLGDRVEPRFLFAAAIALFGVSLLLVVNAQSVASLTAFGACMGVGWGGA